MSDKYYMNVVSLGMIDYHSENPAVKSLVIAQGINSEWGSLKPKPKQVYKLIFQTKPLDKQRHDKNGNLFKYKEPNEYFIGKFENEKVAWEWRNFFAKLYSGEDWFQYYFVVSDIEYEYYDWSKVKYYPPSVDSFDPMI